MPEPAQTANLIGCMVAFISVEKAQRRDAENRGGSRREKREGGGGIGMFHRFFFPPRASAFLGASAWSFSPRAPSQGYPAPSFSS